MDPVDENSTWIPAADLASGACAVAGLDRARRKRAKEVGHPMHPVPSGNIRPVANRGHYSQVAVMMRIPEAPYTTRSSQIQRSLLDADYNRCPRFPISIPPHNGALFRSAFVTLSTFGLFL